MAEPALFAAQGIHFSPKPGLTHRINFQLGTGCALRIAGASGSGKTTLLRILTRLAAAEAGTLLLRGQRHLDVSPSRWRREVHYVFQKPVTLPGTVADNLAAPFQTKTTRDRLDPQQARRILRQLKLEPDQIWSQQANTLSGGEVARVAVCRALLLKPSVLLLDEPTHGLDRDAGERLVERVKQWLAEGGALVLVSHQADAWQSIRMNSIELKATSSD